ncbi:zinc finger protein 1-like [Protopterus annectens]|uniref:zinc finger protein 1-like n=1 Tax=Protopterus annectens TaxID=7888 RepID=UPI001CF940B5|nr:zinc finger protein 1-like [Protopterus annectens]
MMLELPEGFEDVAVGFSREEWDLLSDQEKELHREVMVQNYETMISVGYNIPVDQLWLIIKKHETIPPGDSEEGMIVQQKQLPGNSTDNFSEIQSQQPSCGMLKNFRCHKTLPAKVFSTRYDQEQTENQYPNCVESTDGFVQKTKLEMHLKTPGEEKACKRVNFYNTLRLHSGFWNHSGKNQMNTLETDEPVFTSKKLKKNVVPANERKVKPHIHATCFTKRTELVDHQYIKNEDKKVHKRAVCDKGFVQKSNIIKHQYTHTKQNPHKCDVCGKTFADKRYLIGHQLGHTGEKPYKCTICDNRFIYKSSMLSHQNIHMAKKPYKCPICGKEFTQKGNMKQHQHVHSGHKPYKCTICDKSFVWKRTMEMHESIHTGQKPYKCAMCDKRFTQKSTMVTHQKVHTGEKPFKCTTCGKGFTQKGNMQQHQFVHSDQKPYKCSKCDKSFITKSNMERHQNSHSIQKTCNCATRGKGLVQKDSIRQYYDICTGQKSCKCSVCYKSCVNKSEMVNYHLKTPYKCGICDKNFKCKANPTHNQTVHTEHLLRIRKKLCIVTIMQEAQNFQTDDIQQD